ELGKTGPEHGIVEDVLVGLVSYLRRNGADAPERAIHKTDIIPAVRIHMPRLKQMETTGIASAVIRLGVERGLLGTRGDDLWLIQTSGPTSEKASGTIGPQKGGAKPVRWADILQAHGVGMS